MTALAGASPFPEPALFVISETGAIRIVDISNAHSPS